MQIVKLQTENIKRLKAVAVEPGDRSLVVVGGKNGAGKSSLLDSIAYAVGGKDLVPTQPIRKGQTEAKITVDLGDYVVTRRLTREDITPDCDVANCANGFIDDKGGLCSTCKGTGKGPQAWGDTKSVLTVTNKDGARYPSPQAMLDKMYGRLSFDPLAFAKDTIKRQAEILRELTNLDFSLTDARRKVLFEERTMANKSLKAIEAQVAGLTRYEGVPAEELGADVVRAELEEADRLRTVADDIDHARRTKERETNEMSQRVDETENAIVKTELEMKSLSELLQMLTTRKKGQLNVVHLYEESLAELGKAAAASRAAVPDIDAINAKFTSITDTNRKVRENNAANEKLDRAVALTEQIGKLTTQINTLDEEKETSLATAKFPVPGLGLTDDGPTFNGVPLDQASSSEQLRVSVAIGLALNPQLKVLLVRNGNLLDDDGVKSLAAMAEDAGAQVWMEYVTGNNEGVTILIEDGSVV